MAAAAVLAAVANACSGAPQASELGDVESRRVVTEPPSTPSLPPTLAPTSGGTAAPTPVPTAAAPTPVPTPAPWTCTPPACFDAGEAMRHDRALSVDIGVRDAGSEGDRRAADYIESELRRLGYGVARQAITTPIGAQSQNVIAVPRGIGVDTSGSADPDRPYILVGAHMDTVPGSPGANDNGSGTSAVLEIARALSVRPARLPVAFVLFGAEERQPDPEGGTVKGHIGSKHYVETMTPRAKQNLVALINLDMVGRGTGLVAGKLNRSASEATDRLVSVGRQLNIPITSSVEGDRSDNSAFIRAGMNAGWLWSGRDPAYHSPRDTYDRVQPESVNRAGALALAVARSYA